MISASGTAAEALSGGGKKESEYWQSLANTLYDTKTEKTNLFLTPADQISKNLGGGGPTGKQRSTYEAMSGILI